MMNSDQKWELEVSCTSIQELGVRIFSKFSIDQY